MGAEVGQMPQRFGRYVLLDRMGVGGMAEVYRAVAPGAEGFKRDLVVKKILPHPNTVEFEGETVCLNYDTANTALKGFTFKVDWNKEIQKCLDNAEQENTQLIEYAVDRVIQEAMSRTRA